MSGQVGGLKAGWHVRTNRKTGKVYFARNGNPFSRTPPSPAQLANRQRFIRLAEEYRQSRALRRTPN